MAFDHRDNSGTMFKNHSKNKENQPDYRGECKINGTVLAISGWIKQGKKGEFLSLAFSEPRQREQDSQAGGRWDAPPQTGNGGGSGGSQADEVPFGPCKH